jgi:hypothetical protein
MVSGQSGVLDFSSFRAFEASWGFDELSVGQNETAKRDGTFAVSAYPVITGRSGQFPE